jgi:hypothetical protein
MRNGSWFSDSIRTYVYLVPVQGKSKTGLRCDTCCDTKASEAKLSLLYKYICEKILTSLCVAKLFPNLQSHQVDWQTPNENFAGIIHRLNLVKLTEANFNTYMPTGPSIKDSVTSSYPF